MSICKELLPILAKIIFRKSVIDLYLKPDQPWSAKNGQVDVENLEIENISIAIHHS